MKEKGIKKFIIQVKHSTSRQFERKKNKQRPSLCQVQIKKG